MYIDQNLQKALSDRIYDKRKPAALQLEQIVRKAVEQGNMEMVEGVITELSRDFAYAVRHPNYRNGGLIGLAAVAIALGQESLPAYLDDIIQPILACFGDADARVRYYACESLYNVAKIAKSEILTYFNEIFDALCKLTADVEESVRNGANLVDQLLRDIVVETAASYLFVVDKEPPVVPSAIEQPDGPEGPTLQKKVSPEQRRYSFSLDRFIPLLVERIYVMNPATRMFLVQWIMLLDSIPDLEIIKFVPEFLEGLLLFLTDTHKDVRVFTKSCLEKLLKEIKGIAELKQKAAASDSGAGNAEDEKRPDETAVGDISVGDKQSPVSVEPSATTEAGPDHETGSESGGPDSSSASVSGAATSTSTSIATGTATGIGAGPGPGSGTPSGADAGLYQIGQDTYIYYSQIVDILLSKMDPSHDETQLVVLEWIEGILDVSPPDVFTKLSTLVTVLLPALSDEQSELRKAGTQLSDRLIKMLAEHSKFIDTSATVNALSRQLENDDKVTRLAALQWLAALYSAIGRASINLDSAASNDDLLVKLISPLSDPSDEVVAQDLDLVSLVLRDASASEFGDFVNRLVEILRNNPQLFAHRGKFICLQLCIQLSPERVFRAFAEIVGRGDGGNADLNWYKDHDVRNYETGSSVKENEKSDGPSIVITPAAAANSKKSTPTKTIRSDRDKFDCLLIQNLNNILLTAPELHNFRVQLTQLHTEKGVDLFTTLFLSWRKNSVATLALCLLAQAYDHAFDVLEILAKLDVTVSTLIRIDKLVQLLEGPVFAPLRMHLLRPQKYHYLYKTLYGLLMVLPQSKAFTILQTRLSSVSGFAQLPTPSSKHADSEEDDHEPSQANWEMLLEKFRETYEKP